MDDDRFVLKFIVREIVELAAFVVWVIFLLWTSAWALNLRTDPMFVLAVALRFLVLPISLVGFVYYTVRRTITFARRLTPHPHLGRKRLK
jgi:thiol:disulfide interchange protein